MDLLEKYMESISSPEEELLTELDRETNLHVMQPRMISGHLQGKLLELLTRVIRPKNVLEIGTFTGYSAICIAAGLEEEGRVDTIEIDDELEDFARSFFNRSSHGHKIRQHVGSALMVAPTLERVYDLVYIDGDKREYTAYYRMLMGDTDGHPLVKSGSIILADNILWNGKVIEPVAANDRFTQDILAFNRMVHDDNRVESVVIPVRDGLSLIRVK